MLGAVCSQNCVDSDAIAARSEAARSEASVRRWILRWRLPADSDHVRFQVGETTRSTTPLVFLDGPSIASLQFQYPGWQYTLDSQNCFARTRVQCVAHLPLKRDVVSFHELAKLGQVMPPLVWAYLRVSLCCAI